MTVKLVGWPPLIAALLSLICFKKLPPPQRGWFLGLLALFAYLVCLHVAVLNPDDEKSMREAIEVFFTASYVVISLLMGQGLIFAAIFFQPRHRFMGEAAPLSRKYEVGSGIML